MRERGSVYEACLGVPRVNAPKWPAVPPPQASVTHEGFRGIRGTHEPMSLLGGGPHFPKRFFRKQAGRWNLGLACPLSLANVGTTHGPLCRAARIHPLTVPTTRGMRVIYHPLQMRTLQLGRSEQGLELHSPGGQRQRRGASLTGTGPTLPSLAPGALHLIPCSRQGKRRPGWGLLCSVGGSTEQELFLHSGRFLGRTHTGSPGAGGLMEERGPPVCRAGLPSGSGGQRCLCVEAVCRRPASPRSRADLVQLGGTVPTTCRTERQKGYKAAMSFASPRGEGVQHVRSLTLRCAETSSGGIFTLSSNEHPQGLCQAPP